MSSWTVVTLRAREARDYEHTRSDSVDPWEATCDIAATMDADDRVRYWTVWNSHVYAYLSTRGSFDAAERFFEDYGEMVDDAAVLHANDTSDLGCARYYPDPSKGTWVDEYQEHGDEQGSVGELALAVMTARHGIHARDPFHNKPGLLDENYLEEGYDQFGVQEVRS